MSIYYKSYRIVKGEAKWVITDESGNIIHNPTKDQIKGAISDSQKYKPQKRKYCICGNITNVLN